MSSRGKLRKPLGSGPRPEYEAKRPVFHCPDCFSSFEVESDYKLHWKEKHSVFQKQQEQKKMSRAEWRASIEEMEKWN